MLWQREDRQALRHIVLQPFSELGRGFAIG